MAGIDGSMAHLSDTLFTTSIATYALAMVGFTAEYAFGRKGRVAATLPATAPERELVGAGGPPSVEFVDSDVPPAAPADLGRRSLADRIGRVSFAITVLGVLLHTASIAVRATAVDAVPWSNMYEFSSVAGLVAVIALMWETSASSVGR